MTKASEEWLEQYKREHGERVVDPAEFEDRDGSVLTCVDWTFHVLPPLYNDMLRLFRYEYNEYYRRQQQWVERFALKARKESGPSALFQPPVSVHMIRRSSGEPDPDGLYASFKFPLDALVDAGLLPDDNPNVVDQLSAKHERIGRDEDESVTFTIKSKDP